VNTEIAADPAAELERARSDYLAVSRGAHMFASEDDHRRAEERAWERLERARRQIDPDARVT
jgi:FAD/FMN-containing dehydrogenase